jgi:hypothetical protein
MLEEERIKQLSTVERVLTRSLDGLLDGTIDVPTAEALYRGCQVALDLATLEHDVRREKRRLEGLRPESVAGR